MSEQRIPVTILTGFLGAGKTTALNYLIENNPATKFAIIENEFGDIPIDNDLVIGANSGIFELSNGCICCTLNGELIDTLVELVNSGQQFEHLIVETTGVAEPDGVAAAFVSEPAIQERFRLDATICMVDAHHGVESLEEREEAKRQVTFADVLVINKASEVQEQALEGLKKRLMGANPLASILQCDRGQLPSSLLHVQAYENKIVEEKLKASNKPLNHVCDEHCNHDHKEHAHQHSSDIVTQSFVLDEPLDVLKFRHWLNVLLMIQGQNLYRVKGIVHFQYQDKKAIVQSVKKMCVFSSGEAWAEGENRQSRLVFIGKNLRRDILEKQLRHCLFKAFV
ncbi:MAG: CobW family GTP-binding protein [Aureispira sp.]